MSNAPSKPVSFSRPKVGYFSNRPRITFADFVLSNVKFIIHFNIILLLYLHIGLVNSLTHKILYA